jgi:hypothetical protein
MPMAEFEQDPSANTGRFRAFVEQAQAADSTPRAPMASRSLLIGGAVVLAVIVIVVLIVAVG